MTWPEYCPSPLTTHRCTESHHERAAALGLADTDTSLFIALEHERPLAGTPPERIAVSVITIAELRLGVLVATDGPTRARRLGTLTRADELDPVPVVRNPASQEPPGRSPDHASPCPARRREAHTAQRLSWIAAPALANGIPVVSGQRSTRQRWSVDQSSPRIGGHQGGETAPSIKAGSTARRSLDAW